MAEVWYLDIDTVSLEGKEPIHKRTFKECIELLELHPECWRWGLEETLQLKTGDPLIDGSGYVYVLIRVTEDEIGTQLAEEGWKPGWYRSPLSVIKAEKNLREIP